LAATAAAAFALAVSFVGCAGGTVSGGGCLSVGV
jgi:hypothetical protein